MKNHILEKIDQIRELDPNYYYYRCKKCGRDFWRGTKDQYGTEEIEFPKNLKITTQVNGGGMVYHEGIIYVFQSGKPTYILECTLTDEEYEIKAIIK